MTNAPLPTPTQPPVKPTTSVPPVAHSGTLQPNVPAQLPKPTPPPQLNQSTKPEIAAVSSSSPNPSPSPSNSSQTPPVSPRAQAATPVITKPTDVKPPAPVTTPAATPVPAPTTGPVAAPKAPTNLPKPTVPPSNKPQTPSNQPKPATAPTAPKVWNPPSQQALAQKSNVPSGGAQPAAKPGAPSSPPAQPTAGNQAGKPVTPTKPVQPLAQAPAPAAAPKPAPVAAPAKPVIPVAAPAKPPAPIQPAAPASALPPAKPATIPAPIGPVAPPKPGPTQPPVKPGAPTLPGLPTPPSAGLPPTPPVPPATPGGSKSPVMAGAKKSPLRFLPFVLLGVVILGIIGFAASFFLNQSSNTADTSDSTGKTAASAKPTTKQVTLTYWGLWEPTDAMTAVLADFEKANPGIKVQYTKQSPKDYRERLQTAIASGSGPDLYRFHATWVPMLKAELSPMPSSVMSATEYQRAFYPVASKQLSWNGQIVGVPLMYEGLALYYNKDILQTAGVEPPTTWSVLRTLASQLTVRSSTGIQRAGLAIGTATNVDNFSDILGLLMLQNGADLSNPTTVEARDALTFYTNFAKVDKVWDSTLPASTVAFSRGDVAMIFAPSWRVHEIKAMNPSLNFGIAPVPRLSEDNVAWASYWAEGVSAQSKSKDESWKLLKYLSSSEVQQKLHSSQTQVAGRSFGEMYSRPDLASSLASDTYVAPYLSTAQSAQGWYLSSNTFDNGINDQIIKYFEDAVTAVVNGKDAQDVLPTVDQGVKQVLRQYGVPVTGTTAR